LPKKNKNDNLGWGNLGDALKMGDAAYKLNLRKGARCFMAVRHYAGGGLGNLFFCCKSATVNHGVARQSHYHIIVAKF